MQPGWSLWQYGSDDEQSEKRARGDEIAWLIARSCDPGSSLPRSRVPSPKRDLRKVTDT
jgi:hypothetical protein